MDNVLLIEDDYIEQLKFEKVCKKHFPEINVVIKSNGDEAGVYIDEHPYSFDLMILDLNMPRVSGVEFLTTHRSKISGEIVVITSSSNQSDIDAVKSLNVLGYFIKPLHLEHYEHLMVNILTFITKNRLK